MGSFEGDLINLATPRKSKIEIFSSFLSGKRMSFIDHLRNLLERVAIRQFPLREYFLKQLMVNQLS